MRMKPLVMIDEPRAQDAHEAGEDDEFGFVHVEDCRDGAVEHLAARVVAMLDALGRDAGLSGALEAEGVGPVAEDDAELEVEIAIGDAVDESLEVGA
jgi:hypothetical protein